MASQRSIRIFSDLHLAHPASLIREVHQLEPLLEGVGMAIFNGDSAELRLNQARARAEECLGELRQLCQRLEVEPVFLNGNHDPDVSNRDHFELMDGRMLVIHGHALFPSITPWSLEAKPLEESARRALREICGETEPRMEEALLAVREACLRTPARDGQMPSTELRWWRSVFAELGHPFRTLQVLRAWATTPARAASFAARFCPDAEWIVTGHTHFPGCWRSQGRRVMNTGAYFPWLGRRFVDLTDGVLTMRKVEGGSGETFRAGREVFRCPPTPSKVGLEAPLAEHSE